MTVKLTEPVDQRAIDTYHRLLYSLDIDNYPCWEGVTIRKNPLDLWVYAELIQRVEPDIIIETGTAAGGSALFFKALQDRYNADGWVITIDEKPAPAVIQSAAGIASYEGKSQDAEIAEKVRRRINKGAKVFVSLDAGHLTHEVEVELELYAPMVTPGSYCVVEDTNIEGRPLGHAGVNGPGRAAREFLESHAEFEPDKRCERFMVTYNPGGWLKRWR